MRYLFQGDSITDCGRGDYENPHAMGCGYPNQLHFSRAFKKRYGISPREWRTQNKLHSRG